MQPAVNPSEAKQIEQDYAHTAIDASAIAVETVQAGAELIQALVKYAKRQRASSSKQKAESSPSKPQPQSAQPKQQEGSASPGQGAAATQNAAQVSSSDATALQLAGTARKLLEATHSQADDQGRQTFQGSQYRIEAAPDRLQIQAAGRGEILTIEQGRMTSALNDTDIEHFQTIERELNQDRQRSYSQQLAAAGIPALEADRAAQILAQVDGQRPRTDAEQAAIDSVWQRLGPKLNPRSQIERSE